VLDSKTISNYRQNKPTLIVKDLEKYGVPGGVTYRILLARGVFKWLARRRDLIKLKIQWRKQTTWVIEMIQSAKAQKNYKRRMYYKGYLAGLEMCRRDIEALCHSERWTVQDNDTYAQTWLDDEKGRVEEMQAFDVKVGC
jgi:hypothetical protein